MAFRRSTVRSRSAPASPFATLYRYVTAQDRPVDRRRGIRGGESGTLRGSRPFLISIPFRSTNTSLPLPRPEPPPSVTSGDYSRRDQTVPLGLQVSRCCPATQNSAARATAARQSGSRKPGDIGALPLRQLVLAVDLVGNAPVRVGSPLVRALPLDALQLPRAAREAPGALAAHGLSVFQLAGALILGDPCVAVGHRGHVIAADRNRVAADLIQIGRGTVLRLPARHHKIGPRAQGLADREGVVGHVGEGNRGCGIPFARARPGDLRLRG